MKELSIEEKAKAYDEALKWMRDLYPNMGIAAKEKAESIFHELRESENEEIRKWIINEIKIKHHNLDEDNVDFVDKAIAWLEKQGNYHKGFHDGYQHGVHEEKPLKWTKHDELVRKEAISCLKHWRSLIPDTWNEDYKNILMWLENELSIHAEKQGEQKPAEWSEEDEYNLQCIIAKVTSDIQKGNVGRNNELINWLNFLKQRYTWKPSKEQMQALLSEVEGWVKGCPKQKVLESLYNDLKKL